MKTTQIIKNQKGFTLIELMVVAVILAIISAIAVPIYNGYKKEAYTQEAYTLLSMMADSCIGKAQKAAATGGTIGTVSPSDATEHFTFTVTTACAATAGVFTATADGTDGFAATDTLVLTVDPSATPPTKEFSGNLF